MIEKFTNESGSAKTAIDPKSVGFGAENPFGPCIRLSWMEYSKIGENRKPDSVLGHDLEHASWRLEFLTYFSKCFSLYYT